VERARAGEEHEAEGHARERGAVIGAWTRPDTSRGRDRGRHGCERCGTTHHAGLVLTGDEQRDADGAGRSAPHDRRGETGDEPHGQQARRRHRLRFRFRLGLFGREHGGLSRWDPSHHHGERLAVVGGRPVRQGLPEEFGVDGFAGRDHRDLR
jgi:hypothetical protein